MKNVKLITAVLAGFIGGIAFLMSCGTDPSTQNGAVNSAVADELTITTYDMRGEWDLKYILTIDPNHPGVVSDEQTVQIVIDACNFGSGEFSGKRKVDGVLNSNVYGRIISGSGGSYTQDIIKFDLINTDGHQYRSSFIAQIAGENSIINGSFVDSYGSVATFTMTRN